MPEITVSETVYRQLKSEAKDGDLDKMMMRMVSQYRRGNNPGD
jgi:hypothetical protein